MKQGEEQQRWARERVTAAVGQLTDGQRWTLAVAAVFLTTFLGFGLRRAPLATLAQASTPRQVSAAMPTGAPVTPTTTSTRPPDMPRPSVGRGSAQTPSGGAEPVALAPPTPKIVAVVRSSSGGQVTHDDAFVASAFLSSVHAPVDVVSADNVQTALCAAAVPNRIVVAGDGLDRALRDCILQTGTTMVSYDSLGSSDGALSTRLGGTDAILASASVVPTDKTIGIAVSTTLTQEANTAMSRLQQLGYRVVVASVSSGDLASIQSAVVAFAAANVQSVIFAMPVADQSSWLGLEPVFGLHATHVVSDVADAVVNESYLPVADGLVAVVANRVPWYARAHGATSAQAQCDDQYKRTASSGAATAAEQSDVYAWCQNVAILNLALQSQQPFATVLASLTLDSPLTSSLGVGPDGGVRPQQVAELVWQFGCRCWNETKPFADWSPR